MRDLPRQSSLPAVGFGSREADSRARAGVRAWALLELVGVLAIIAMLTVVGAGAGLAYCDQLARNRERSTLQEFAESLRRSVTRDLRIPDHLGYFDQIAIYSGHPVEQILVNRRGNRRLLLIDPGISNSGISLPFDQASAGLSGAGAGALGNVRMLLVSSLGAPLPQSLGVPPGGIPSGVIFSNCWSTPQGQIPAGLDWQGDPADFFLQRIQFADLFHPVALNHAELTGSFTNGQLRLPGMNVFASPPGAPLPSIGRYLHGSMLVLSNAADATVFTEIVQDSLMFTYENGRWLRGTQNLVSGEGLRSPITGADFEEAVREFLATAVDDPDGAGDGGPGSRTAAEAVVNSMSNYIRLGALGPDQRPNMNEALDDLSDALLDYALPPPEELDTP